MFSDGENVGDENMLSIRLTKSEQNKHTRDALGRCMANTDPIFLPEKRVRLWGPWGECLGRAHEAGSR